MRFYVTNVNIVTNVNNKRDEPNQSTRQLVYSFTCLLVYLSTRLLVNSSFILIIIAIEIDIE